MPALVVVVLLVIVVVLAVVVVPVVVGVVRDKEERRRPAGRDECDIIDASPSVGVTSRKTSLPFCANRGKDKPSISRMQAAYLRSRNSGSFDGIRERIWQLIDESIGRDITD